MRPSRSEAGDDGGEVGQREAGADDRFDDDAEGATDGASYNDGDAGPASDSAADRETLDGASDASLDTVADVASDAPFDGTPDASLDVDNDVTSDALPDVSLDVVNDRKSDAGDGGRVLDARDAGQDATDGAGAADVFDDCTVSCWPDADYYVDATAPSGGNGSKQQPFKTITAAVQAYAATSGVAKKAYVAPGTYDQSLGEQFPLVLRGLSLQGAGQDRTLIVGAGRYDNGAEAGSISGILTTTIVIGERDLPTELSGCSVRSTSPVPVESTYGVFCDRGNATGAVASPLGQTHLDQVTVGPGYGYDVAVATSTSPSSTGCNMLITRSTITAAWEGVIAVGCGSSANDDPVMLEMGTDDPGSGNIISWMTAANTLGIGIALQDCLIRGSFQYNSFLDSRIGASVSDLGRVSPPNTRVNLTFKHNVFERLSQYGLFANGYTLFVQEISANRFSDVTKVLGQAGGEAAALFMDMFNVGKLRGNEFVGNDTAIEAGFSVSSGTPADFGTALDPGNNVFRCNSAQQGSGGDVMLTGNSFDPEVTWAGTVHLAGNAWDHQPPTLLTADPPPNGADISQLYAPHVDIDRVNAVLSSAACPSGRVPGQ